MQTSTMLQWKISGTKKRLFDGFIPVWSLPMIALTGLICTVAALVRIISVGGSYTVVPMQIPVVSAPMIDRSAAGFREVPAKALDKTSLAVALTPSEFIFGDLSAFTSAKDDIRGKFVIPHVEGSPRVDVLLEQVKAWQEDRVRRLSVRPDQLVVLIPDGRVPMNIVIQVSNLIRASRQFENVILAGGLE